MPSSSHVLVIGAGLAGSLLATQLAREGFRVSLYERRSDPRAKGHIGGRSINLAISVRGIEALRSIGLDGAVLEQAIRMPGRMIHPVHGDLVFQPYSADPSRGINSVSRGGLNLLLLEAAAAEPNVTLVFDRPCIDVKSDGTAAVFRDPASGTEVTVAADLVIATDGAYSAVRQSMQRTERFDYSQSYLGHGYKELTIPPHADGTHRLDPHALHIWPRGGHMMIALPNVDGSFTCTCFMPYEGPDGFAALRTRELVAAYFARVFPDAAALMPDLLDEWERNPVGAMVTVRCFPWHRDSVALLGDAAHAIVPFYGQGANCAFEDTLAMINCLKRHAPDWPAAFAAYESIRKPNADAIADLAVANFIEMRDRTASRLFRAKKRLERVLSRVLPGAFLPLYDMVSFSTIPYAEARARARRQWWAVGSAAAVIGVAALLGLVAIASMSVPTPAANSTPGGAE
ncbi:MAG: FAD-dependent monooxygenase [Phycisphaerales bacterium]|nr:FAD-dependent monooxygenase [Phycisphaerales bacterium]